MKLHLIHGNRDVLDVLRRGAGVPGVERVTAASSVELGVRGASWNVDAIIFDLQMDRHRGMRIERALRRANPTALLVALGPPVPGSVAFRLASVGVAAFIDVPVDEDRVKECLKALVEPKDLLVRAAQVEVGARDLKQAQRVVRLSMCREALARTGGSRRAAAHLLGVDRRAVQKIAGELPVDEIPGDEVADEPIDEPLERPLEQRLIEETISVHSLYPPLRYARG